MKTPMLDASQNSLTAPANPPDTTPVLSQQLTGQGNILHHRRKALSEVDNASFSWFHVRVCLVAGTGFFTAAYDIFAINIAWEMLRYVYGEGPTPFERTLSRNQELSLKISSPIGTLCGQLLFGWLGDLVGRKKMYGVELIITIVATFGQAVSGDGRAISIIGVLTVWRFIMGIGIGGDYPLSAVISSEFASIRIRGRMLNFVFATQGFGTFTAILVGFIVVTGYKHQLISENSNFHVDYMWRLLIGLGCIPAAVALYFRLTITETPRFTMDIERNIVQATADIHAAVRKNNPVIDPDAVTARINAPKSSWIDFVAYFRQWKNMKLLIGTSWSWFALDIAFYGLGLNASTILQDNSSKINVLRAIGFQAPKTTDSLAVYHNLKNICAGNLILSAAGLIPGYWVSFIFIDSWGRKPIQLMGFIMLTIIFLIIGFGYDVFNTNESSKKAFVFLYCLANFFQNFGPNTTTFIIPGELFPTRYRSTAFGIAAASGKLGSIIAQVVFTRLKSIKTILEVFAFFMLTGIASTLLLPETKNQTLEELSKEEVFEVEPIMLRQVVHDPDLN